MISPIQRMTSAFSSAGDRSSRFPGGDMPLQNLKSLYAESPDLLIFTRAVSPCPPTAAASKTSAARTFAPITSGMGNRSAEVAKPGSALPRPARRQDASAPHFADQASEKLFTASSISGSQLLQDGPWYDDPAVRSPF